PRSHAETTQPTTAKASVSRSMTTASQRSRAYRPMTMLMSTREIVRKAARDRQKPPSGSEGVGRALALLLNVHLSVGAVVVALFIRGICIVQVEQPLHRVQILRRRAVQAFAAAQHGDRIVQQLVHDPAGKLFQVRAL